MVNEDMPRGVGERVDGVTGNRLAARSACSGNRASAAGWPTSSTGGVRWRLGGEARPVSNR